jgi:hypothetical protein
MSDCINACEGLNTGDKTYDILIAELTKEINELCKTSTAKFLFYDEKVAELCTYIKANLSNSIQCLLGDMKLSGELDTIINEVVLIALSTLEMDMQELKYKTLGFITPQMFGACGDGECDDTEAIRKAIENMNGRTLYFPTGTYLVTGDLIIDSDNVDICISENAKIICNVETTTGGVIQCVGYYGKTLTPTDTIPRRNGLHIYGGGSVVSNNANTNAIGFGRWDNVVIENVTAISERKGITGQYGGSNITVRDCNIYGNTIASITFESEMDNILIDNCVMIADGETIRNINIHSDIKDVVIKNCKLTANYRNIRINDVKNVLISNCVCETKDTMNIDINADCDNVKVEKCTLTGSTTYGVYVVNGLKSGIFSENNITAGTGFYIASPLGVLQILNNKCSGVIYNIAGSGSVNPIANGNIGNGITGYVPLFGCNSENGKQIWYEEKLKRSRGSKPTSGTHLKGEIVYNNDCNGGSYLGWICTETGTPGKWKGFGLVEN